MVGEPGRSSIWKPTFRHALLCQIHQMHLDVHICFDLLVVDRFRVAVELKYLVAKFSGVVRR
jgi:hypothetical protein